MKAPVPILFLVFLALYSCHNRHTAGQSDGFIIKGHVNGIPSGTVKLLSDVHDTTKTFDSAAVTGGSFELKGSIGIPRMMTLVVEPGNWSFPVFIEDTILQVSADTAGARHYDYTKYGDDKGAYINSYTETGSGNFDAWKQYQDDPGQKQYDPALAALHMAFGAADSKAEQYRIMDQMDSVRNLLREWQMKWIDSFADRDPALVAGAYMFWRAVNGLYYSIPFSTLEQTINKFTGKAKASVYYRDLAAALARLEAVQPGHTAPDFSLRKRDSSAFRLSSSRGRYVMIDFWASWCLPCRQAIPHWKKAYKKYRDKGFDIVGVASDRRWSDWIKALDQEKMPWIQVNDEFPERDNPLGRVGSLYLTRSIPFYVLLDKEGKILVYSNDEHIIDAKLEEIFGS